MATQNISEAWNHAIDYAKNYQAYTPLALYPLALYPPFAGYLSGCLIALGLISAEDADRLRELSNTDYTLVK